MSRCRLFAVALAGTLWQVPVYAAGAPNAAHVLQAASGSSPRPPECRAYGVDRAYTLWDKAREPGLVLYCNALARGYARLALEPGAALEAAEQAARAQPERLAPLLLKARALVEQGSMKEAFESYQQAHAREPALRLAPAALHAYALAALGSGEPQIALSTYRRLVPMAGLLTDPADSEGVLVEAATLVMRYDPTHLQEAVAYLNEARRQNAIPALRPFILGGLALALERQGRTEEARGVAREAHGRVGLLVSVADEPQTLLRPRVRLPRIASVEVLAMVAVLSDRPDARQYWSEFIAKAPVDHPWLGHARAELGRKVE